MSFPVVLEPTRLAKLVVIPSVGFSAVDTCNTFAEDLATLHAPEGANLTFNQSLCLSLILRQVLNLVDRILLCMLQEFYLDLISQLEVFSQKTFKFPGTKTLLRVGDLDVSTASGASKVTEGEALVRPGSAGIHASAHALKVAGVTTIEPQPRTPIAVLAHCHQLWSRVCNLVMWAFLGGLHAHDARFIGRKNKF